MGIFSTNTRAHWPSIDNWTSDNTWAPRPEIFGPGGWVDPPASQRQMLERALTEATHFKAENDKLRVVLSTLLHNLQPEALGPPCADRACDKCQEAIEAMFLLARPQEADTSG